METLDNKKIRIGIDIDDTISKTSEHIVEMIRERLGKDARYEDIKVAYDWSVFGLNEEETKLAYSDYYKEEVSNFPICNEAKEFIDEISDEVEIFFITGRKPEYFDLTKKYLEKHFPSLNFTLFHSKNISHPGKSKFEICCENKIDFFVDDYLHFFEGFEEGKIKCLLIERPWNKYQELPSNIIRVKNWNEVKIEFQKTKLEEGNESKD